MEQPFIQHYSIQKEYLNHMEFHYQQPTFLNTTAKNTQSKPTQNKKSDEEIKSSLKYKSLTRRLEVCQGTNVSLSNKISKLEETVRILQ